MQPGAGRKRGRPAGCAAGDKQQQQVLPVAQRPPALSVRCLGRLLNAVIEDGVLKDPPVRALLELCPGEIRLHASSSACLHEQPS
jgi:hypothetical protein